MATTNPSLANYWFVFDFERDYDHVRGHRWLAENWTNGFYCCAAYVLLVFGIRHVMRDRTGFKLKGPLIFWNTLLAVFSIYGFTRTSNELFRVLGTRGLRYSTCVSSFLEDEPVSSLWSLLFVLSKLPELVDTVFVVLRKRPLIFLHWYHHVTVLLYSWYSYVGVTSCARWFIVMNYGVHSMMYTYYAARAMGFRPPKALSMFVTGSQLLQMVGGCFINYATYGYISAGGPESCRVTKTNIAWSSAMYFSYLVLFARFFYEAYVARPAKQRLPVATRQKTRKQH